MRNSGRLSALCAAWVLGGALAMAALLWPPQARAAAWPAPCDETQGQIVTDILDSVVYDGPVHYDVYLPPCYDTAGPRLPVMYLLHGGSGNQAEWWDLGVPGNADALIANGAPPFLVVMPGGVYLPSLNYETFVLRDLLPNVQCRYRARSDTAGQTIGGVSLGGYWALRTAFEHPHLFAGVGGHSPVVDLGGPNDPWALAPGISNTVRLPVMLDAGTDDSLFYEARTLAKTLQANGVSVTFAAYRGIHERSYWVAHTGEYLSGYLQAITPAADWPGWMAPMRACSGRFYFPGVG